MIVFKFQEIEQSLLYINGAVMLLILFVGLANLVVTISRKRETKYEEIYKRIWFIPPIASLCGFSLVPSSIRSIATPLTMAVSGILIFLFILVMFLIQRRKKQ